MQPRPVLFRPRVPTLGAATVFAVVAGSHDVAAQQRDPSASTGTIAGAVRDSSGAPLGGANLVISGTMVRAISDTVGQFRLSGVPTGARTLLVRRLGYRAASMPVTVEIGSTASITVVLVRLPQELDPVVVAASRQPGIRHLQGFYERRSKGHGYFVTRDQLAARNWFNTTDVLRTLVPAVRITSSRMARNAVRFRSNRCPPLLWLDGAPATAGEFDLDVLSPETIAGIEVYPGPATVPVEFRAPRGLDACGVIVVWSRIEAPEPREPRRARRNAAAIAATLDSLAVARVYNAEEVDTAASVDSAGMSEPFYPDSLYAYRIAGEVVAQFVVDTTGLVLAETFTAVSSTHTAFTESVRRSLGRSRFRPAILGGRRVRQVMVLPYRFVMEDRR